MVVPRWIPVGIIDTGSDVSRRNGILSADSPRGEGRVFARSKRLYICRKAQSRCLVTKSRDKEV